MTRDELATLVERTFSEGGAGWGGMFEGDSAVLVLTDGTTTLTLQGEVALHEWNIIGAMLDLAGEYYRRGHQDRINRYVATLIAARASHR